MHFANGLRISKQALRYHEEHGEGNPALHRESLDQFERAIDRAPNWVMPRVGASQTLINLKRYEEALKQAKIANRLAPDSATVQRLLGEAKYFLGDFARAKKHYKAAITFDSVSTHEFRFATRKGIGDSLERQGQFEEARQAYKAAMAEENLTPKEYQWLREALDGLGYAESHFVA